MQGRISEEKGRGTSSAQIDKARLRGLLRALAVRLLWLGAGYLTGSAPLAFGTYPLGVALLCASRHYTLEVLLGISIAAVTRLEHPILCITVYLLTALVRIAAGLLLDTPEVQGTLPTALCEQLENASTHARLRRACRELANAFGRSLPLRMCMSALAVTAISVGSMLLEDFRFYGLWGLLFSLLVAPAATAVWSVCLSGRRVPTLPARISEGLLLFAIIFSARDVTVSGFSLPVILAFSLSLFSMDVRGAAVGIAAGILFGIACDPILAPSFLLAVLVYAAFVHLLERPMAGISASLLGALVWGLYIKGPASLLSLLPPLAIGGAAIALRGVLVPADKLRVGVVIGHATRAHNGRGREVDDRFRGISDAFSSLSEVFYDLSDRFRRPAALDLRKICDTAFDRHCAACPNRSICWGLEYSATLNTVGSLITSLQTGGRVTRDCVPRAFLARCEAMPSILDRINRDCASLTAKLLESDRTGIFAMDYEAAAQIINDALEEDGDEYRFDPEEERRVGEYLSDAGILFSGISVWGKRRRRILVRGVSLDGARISPETLRDDLSELCGLALASPVFELEEHGTTMVLAAKKKLSVVGAKHNISSSGGVSGDTVNLFSNKQDYLYALINDGMGSGALASDTSSLCSVFLEKMLRAGNRAGTSLRMLNNLICSRDTDSARECSSTVDLLELDLMNGRASFLKSGAAPSFVLRAGVVHRINVGTAPIGIIPDIETASASFDLFPGDLVVLVSDGILPDEASLDRLAAYLSTASELTPEEVVHHITLAATASPEHDDCSAIALKILGE